jgi:hypothetical protein
MGAVAVVVVVVATGCSGSTPARDPAAEARVVSETNAFCRHPYALPAAARRPEKETLAIQHRFHVLETALSRTAAYLPAGRDFNEAKAARRALFAEDSKRSHAGFSRRGDFDLRFDRLQLRIYSDELALGLTCAGLAPEARRLARILGTS